MKKCIDSEALKDIDKAIGARKTKSKVTMISDKLKNSIDKNKV